MSFFHVSVLILLSSLNFAVPLTFESQHFNLQSICPLEYGLVLNTEPEPSTLSCAVKCSASDICLSFVYNVTSSNCIINAAGAVGITTGCTVSVEYGEKATAVGVEITFYINRTTKNHKVI